MSTTPITIEEEVEVGTNGFGYTFCVGLVSGCWLGYARTGGGLFLMSEIATGHQLGIVDRDEAIRRVGALAQDPENAYGGIDLWFVAEDLRGDPEAYRCAECGRVCCDGDHEDDGFDHEEYP
jgi:hypothetical protein